VRRIGELLRMTAPFPALQVAGAHDLPEVERLLESAGLTRDGLAACARDGNLIVARAEDGCLMGCVGVEMFDGSTLLRSLAVTAGARGHGLGGALVARALDNARAAGAREAWLLTETAGPFFAARGWETADRAAAPAGVAGSIEFRKACPSSVPAMRRDLR
jgi:N-acetylglutamate synthase-like GNAT family acetyltransferase